eukprot:2425080-Alexandrium_andersonii.AAC.1
MRRSLSRPLTLHRRTPESVSEPNFGRSSTSKQSGRSISCLTQRTPLAWGAVSGKLRSTWAINGG